jgi:uncharacterized membrane protein YqiK
MDILQLLSAYWWIIPLLIALIFYKWTARLFGIVMIPETGIGLINKKFKLFGANRELPADRIVALNGEAGYQAQTLAPGMHFFFWPWQYNIDIIPFTVIPKGKIGLVIARDGSALPQNRILGKYVDCDSYQDSVKFLKGNGQKGRQSYVMLTGAYRINKLLFEIELADITAVDSSKVGIVTAKDGIPLPEGEIAGKIVVGHDNFQNFDAFIDAKGSRGLQQQVLLAGSWNLNPWAIDVKIVDMVSIPIGWVGVVNSYVGNEGKDLSGAAFEHGNIVSKGEKGVWSETYGPGKYPINTSIMMVELVPTTNLVLNWATGRTESHELDKNLSTITVRSKDGFTFNLDVSQIIHVPAIEAPKVIARFGTMKNLVSQVLEPTIGNYFRNSAQNEDVISFLKTRKERQQEAKKHIEDVLKIYNVKAVDTLIGDITPPEKLMETLTNRKLADENKTTYESQKVAEEKRQELEKQKALANIQPKIVEADMGVQIAGMNANAEVKKAEGDANAKKLRAIGEAEMIKQTGLAEAEKILAIGKSTAESYQLQADAMGPDNLTKQLILKSIAENKIRIVPDIVAGGQGSGMIDGLLGVLLTNQMSDKTQKESEKKLLVEIDNKKVSKEVPVTGQEKK